MAAREWVTPDDAAIPGVVSASTIRAWASADKVRSARRRAPGARREVLHVERAHLRAVLAKNPKYIAYIEQRDAAAKAQRERSTAANEAEQLRERIATLKTAHKRDKAKLQAEVDRLQAEVTRLASTTTRAEIDRLTLRLERTTTSLTTAQKRAKEAQERAEQAETCRSRTEADHDRKWAASHRAYTHVTSERDAALAAHARVTSERDAALAAHAALQAEHAALQARAEQHRASATGAGFALDLITSFGGGVVAHDQRAQADAHAALQADHTALRDAHTALQAALRDAHTDLKTACNVARHALRYGWTVQHYGIDGAAQRRGMPDMADVVDRLSNIDLRTSTYTDACIVAYSMTLDDVDAVLTAIGEHCGGTPDQRRKDLLAAMGWRLESGVRLVPIGV